MKVSTKDRQHDWHESEHEIHTDPSSESIYHKLHRSINGEYSVTAPALFLILVLGIGIFFPVALYATGNPTFHNYLSNPLYSVWKQSCPNYPLQYGGNPTICSLLQDPTTSITHYTAPNSNLGEFNTAGKVTYGNSGQCGALSNQGSTSTCITLTATKPPPPLAIQFKQATPIKTLYAIITPQTLNSVYKRISWFTNNTIQFDVTGGHAQTISWTITTTQITNLIFFGIAPTVTCVCIASFNNNIETLLYHPSVTDTFTLVYTGANLNFLGALVESVNPIGDLSPVVAKELEIQFDWGLVNNKTVTTGTGCANYQCSWGFFLTTNKTLWSTSNPNFTPYTDPSIALFVEVHFVSGNTYSTSTFIQSKIGETLSQEDTLGCSGSGFLCTSTTNPNVGTTGMVSYTLLNYTGSSKTNQVGGSALCNNPFVAGGGGNCSYEMLYGFSAATFGNFGSSVLVPALPISSPTYYAGFWIGASQTGSGIQFCYDNGGNTIHHCNQALTSVLNGCSAASMEINYCIPDPTATYSPAPTTDSGGFFGSALHFLSGVGNFIVGGATSLYNTIVSPISNGLSGIEGALVAAFSTSFQVLTFALVTMLNTVGNWFGLGNVGTFIANFFNSIGAFLSGVLGGIFSFFINGVTYLKNGVTLISSFFSTTNILGLWNGFLTGLPALISGLDTFLGYLLFWYNLGVFGFNIVIIFAVILLALAALVDYEQSHNPIALFVGMIMAFFTFYVMTLPNSAINIIATNPTILSSYQTAFTNTLFFIKLAPILFILMLANYMTEGTDLSSFTHGGSGFMTNFTSTLRFYQMVTVDLFKAGLFVFNFSVTMITRIKQLVAGWL